MEQREFLCIAGGKAKWYGYTGRQFGHFLGKQNKLLPYDPAIMILGLYTNELKSYVHKNPANP